MSTLSVIYKIGADISDLKTGVEKTASILENLQSATMKVGGAFGLAFGASEVISFGKEIIELGGHLQDLKERTGIAVEALQELSELASENSTDINALAGAINQMQRRLVGEDKGAVGAIEELNLSLSDLAEMTPDKQFHAIAEAIQGIEDPAKQVELGWKLFGKTFGEVKAAVMSDTEEIRDKTLKMSTDTALALKQMGDDAGRAWRNMKAMAAETIAFIWNIPATEGEKAKREVQDAEDLIKQLHDMAGGAKSPFANMADQSAGKPLPVPDAGWIKDYTRGLEILTEQSMKANEEAQKYGVIVRENIAFTNGFGAVVETIDGALLEGIRYYKERGDSLEKISEMYGLLPEQVSALTQQFAFEESVITATDKAFKGFVATVQEVEQPLDDLASTILPEFNVQTADSVVRLGGLGQQLGFTSRAINEVRANTVNWGSVTRSVLGDMNHIFESAFRGGGGIGGAIMSLSTTVTSSLLKMIPVIGPFLSQFSGAIVAGLSKLGGKIKSFFSDLFGGPSGDELAGRDLVAKFQANFSSVDDMINKVGEAVRAAGGTSEEAQALIKAMWDAEKNGAGATQAAIQKIIDILHKVPTNIDVSVNVRTNGEIPQPSDVPDFTANTPEPPVFGMASGGMGRTTGPTWFYSRGDEDFAFSGEGQSFGGGGGTTNVYVAGSVISERELAAIVNRTNDGSLRLRRKLAAA